MLVLVTRRNLIKSMYFLRNILTFSSLIWCAKLKVLSLPNCFVSFPDETKVNIFQDFIKHCSELAGINCSVDQNKQLVTFERGTNMKECADVVEKKTRAKITQHALKRWRR